MTPIAQLNLRNWRLLILSDQIVDNVARDIRKAEIAAAVPVGQFLVIDAHQIKDGCVDVVNMRRLLDRFETALVSRTINRAAFNSPTGQPHRESEWIMVAAALDSITSTADFAH